MIAQLLITFGPAAVQLIESLVSVWEKPALSAEEVKKITDLAKTSYDDYIKEAKANLGKI